MSNGTFSKRLTEIDDLTRPDHCFLSAADRCFYFGEYSSRAGYDAGPTNQLIFNFKKGVDRKGKPEWKYKERSISEAAAAFASALNPGYAAEATFVPIPPSKAKNHALYDDRMIRMLREMKLAKAADIRELLWQNGTRETAAHDGDRPGPDELAQLYRIEEAVAAPHPKRIALFDDVLVTGASFVAAKRVLQAKYPNIEVIGLFIARRALPDPAQFFDMIEDL
jgi:hypothetical protein